MKEKHFELPKEFTKKWLKALRSGKYEQGTGYLFDYENSETDDEGDTHYDKSSTKLFCCLGIGGKVCNLDEIDMLGIETFSPDSQVDGFPKILKDNDHPLTRILISLNDGLSIIEHRGQVQKFPNLVFNKTFPKGVSRIIYSFKEIADWIETNVKLI